MESSVDHGPPRRAHLTQQARENLAEYDRTLGELRQQPIDASRVDRVSETAFGVERLKHLVQALENQGPRKRARSASSPRELLKNLSLEVSDESGRRGVDMVIEGGQATSAWFDARSVTATLRCVFDLALRGVRNEGRISSRVRQNPATIDFVIGFTATASNIGGVQYEAARYLAEQSGSRLKVERGPAWTEIVVSVPQRQRESAQRNTQRPWIFPAPSVP